MYVAQKVNSREQPLVERFLGEVNHDRFTDRQMPWRDRVEALALELRARLVAHPGAVHLLLGGPMDGPNALTLREPLAGVLADAGATPDDAARAATVAKYFTTEQFLWGLTHILDGLVPQT